MKIDDYLAIVKRYLIPQRNFLFSLLLISVNSITEVVMTFFLAAVATPDFSILGFELHLELREKLLILCLIVLLKLFLTLVLQTLTANLQRELLLDFSSSIYEKILRIVDMSYISEKGIGYFWGLAGDESYRLSTSLSNSISLVGSFAMLSAVLIMLMLTSLEAFAFFFFFIFISVFLGKRLSSKISMYGERQSEYSRKANTIFADGINNIKTLRSHNSEAYISRKYKDMLSQYTVVLKANDFTVALLKFVPALSLILLFFLFIILSPSNNLAVYIATAFLFFRALPLAGSIYNSYLRLMSDMKSIRDLSWILLLQEKSTGNSRIGPVEFIEFKSLSVGYNSRPIISNFSASFEPGRIYGIKGRSGIGKSTLFDVLLRYKDKLSGEILVNGQDFEKIDRFDLRSQIRLVEQGYTVFNDTFLNNVLLSRSPQPLFLNDLLSSFELNDYKDKLESYDLNYGGTNLSGGQKQRLSIIRGLIDHPSVLVLDESLTGLDSKLKKDIFEKVTMIMKSKIVIIISHEESVLEKCDVVYDLNKFLPQN